MTKRPGAASRKLGNVESVVLGMGDRRAHRGRIRPNWGMCMDSGDGFTLLPAGRSPAGRCGSCGAATRPEASRPARGVAEYDDDVVVFRAAGRDGFVVVPRLHVKGIEELSVSTRGGVLAAVRRATNAVRDENSCSEPRIVAVTDSPGSEGHLIIHVQP
jgi:hypothetical protein